MVKVHGMENVPRSGSFIVASNHLGRLDAPLVYYLLDRRDITMLVAEKYREVPLFRWFVKALDALWIDRFNADLGAMRAALKRLKAGHVLVMAPEGTRSPTGALLEGKGGAGYLAARMGIPVLPAAVIGTEDKVVKARLRRLQRIPITVSVGKMFTLTPPGEKASEEQVKAYTDEIMCRIATMLPASYRGVYAAHPRLQELIAKEATS